MEQTMERRRCECCGVEFRPCPQVRDQRRCGEPRCQRWRKQRWKAMKLASDADDADNQAQAQRRWCTGHARYWRDWRSRHPEYCAQNRVRQRARDRRRRGDDLAKSDAIEAKVPIRSGTYRLTPAASEDLAKSDAITVEITVVSGFWPNERGLKPACKEMTR